MDERYFDDDAAMRLVERQRTALGVEPPAGRKRTSPVSELAFGYHEEPPPAREGATLVTHLTASPSEGLIPGAVVTIACAITNDGTARARDVRVAVTLPEASRYVSGSAKRDGTPEPDAEAEALFGEGRALGTLAAGQRVSLIVLLGIEPGLAPLLLTATVTAATGAVIGARSLRLMRSTQPSAFARTLATVVESPAAIPASEAAPIETPFYELDDEEALIYEAADAAIGSAAPRQPPVIAEAIVATTPAQPPVVEQPPLALPKPEPRIAIAPFTEPAVPEAIGAVSTPALAVPPPARQEPLTFSVDLQGGALFSVRLSRARLTLLGQVFNGAKPLGMIGHYLFLNALATVEPMPNASDDSLAAFAAAQEQRLSRGLIAKRLGKTLVPEDVAAPLPAVFPPKLKRAESVDLPTTRGESAILLYRIMRPNELSFLSASVNNVNAAPFMRASQLFVGLCAHNAVTRGEKRRVEIANALRSYSAAAASEINRLFVRARLARKTDLFDLSPPDLDRQARALIELLDMPA